MPKPDFAVFKQAVSLFYADFFPKKALWNIFKTVS